MLYVRCTKAHHAGFAEGVEYRAIKSGNTMRVIDNVASLSSHKGSGYWDFNLPGNHAWGSDFHDYFQVIPKRELKTRYGQTSEFHHDKRRLHGAYLFQVHIDHTSYDSSFRRIGENFS